MDTIFSWLLCLNHGVRPSSGRHYASPDPSDPCIPSSVQNLDLNSQHFPRKAPRLYVALKSTMELLNTRAILIVQKGAPNAISTMINETVHRASAIHAHHDHPTLSLSPTTPNRKAYPVSWYNGVSGSISSLLRLWPGHQDADYLSQDVLTSNSPTSKHPC